MRITTMEAEVLLEALPEEDCRFDHNRDCQEHGYFGIDGKCPVAESKELISTALKAPIGAEPAEPAPVVTELAVEAVARVEYGIGWDEETPGVQNVCRDLARKALQAAAPLLGPRPLLDREAALRAIVAASEPEGSDNIMGREYVENYADVFADAVLKLARPMPTREQIDPFLQEWRVRPPGQPTQQEAVNYRRKMRNALLALLNGAES